MPVPFGEEVSAWKPGLLSFHADVRSRKKASVHGGRTGGADDVFRDLPDFVEDVINRTTIGTLVVVDGHAWVSLRFIRCCFVGQHCRGRYWARSNNDTVAPGDAIMSLDAQKPKESQVDFRTPIPYFEQDPENHRRNH